MKNMIALGLFAVAALAAVPASAGDGSLKAWKSYYVKGMNTGAPKASPFVAEHSTKATGATKRSYRDSRAAR